MILSLRFSLVLKMGVLLNLRAWFSMVIGEELVKSLGEEREDEGEKGVRGEERERAEM